MAKKSTCKANKAPELKLKMYDIAFNRGDKVEHVDICVTHIDADYENLKAYKGDELVGEFREWMYYVRIDDEDDSNEYRANISNSMREDFGSVK